MPPIPQLEKAFQSHLLSEQDRHHELNKCIDTHGLTDILSHLNKTFADLEKELYDCVEQEPLFESWYSGLNRIQQSSEQQLAQNLSLHHDSAVAVIEQHETVCRAHGLAKAKIGALEGLIGQLETLERCEQQLADSDYSEATQTWLSLQVSNRLEAESERVKANLVARVSEALGEALVFGPGWLEVKAVGGLWNALEKLGQLTVEMTSMKRMTFKKILEPFFERPHRLETDAGRLSVVACAETEAIEQIEGLGRLVEFFLKRVLAGEHGDLFGRLFLPDLTGRMVDEILEPAIPLREVAAFDGVRAAAERFKEKCEGRLVEDKLGEFVDQIEKHVAKKRKRQVLKEAREVMLRRLYEVEVVDGYHITQTPRLLRLLIVDNPERAQDVLDMYRALMPSYHRPQFLGDPASALVFRNDCLWLAQQLGEYPGVQALKALGKAWQELSMIQRVDMLQTTLDGLEGFATSQATWDASLGRAVELVVEFSEAIRPVVDESLAQDILGRIVDSVLNRLMGDLEALTEIGAEESHVIAQTLNRVAQLATLVDSVSTVPTWDKFWMLKDILEMNMRDIMERFRRGELHTFEKRELENLLCALFSDSELRRMNIEEIRSGQPSAPLGTVPTTGMYHPEHQETTDRERQPVLPVSQKSALMYDPQEEETTGWDDDDDDDALPEITPPAKDSGHDETQVSLPKSRLSYQPKTPKTTSLTYAPEEEEEAGGWDDDEELELTTEDFDQEGWDEDELELPPDLIEKKPSQQ